MKKNLIRFDIKPKDELPLGKPLADLYRFYINGKRIGQGIKKITLEMEMNKVPTLTIECAPDVVNISEMISKLNVEVKNQADDQ